MSLDQKIGQLFQVATFSNRDKQHEDWIKELITLYHIGGLTFFQGSAERQASLTNAYQRISETPLFINIDAEWGLAMRLRGTIQFPYQMTLGAINDNNLLATMGESLAEQCKALGVQSPLAPVVDVNNNPKNPVISFRSFGENEKVVAQKALVLMEALQKNNILAVAKHFPGHGDTDTDSHLALPLLSHTEERIWSLELYPFQELIDQGLGAIMTAHIQIPALDASPNTPATLSKKIITELLKNQLGFEGLVISDALDMKGITEFYAPGEADKLALRAGNDILTNSVSVPDGARKIKEAIMSGELSEAWLETKVRKILAMKQWTGLDDWKPIVFEKYQEIIANGAKDLNKKLSEKALTLIKNDAAVPIEHPNTCASLHIQCMSEQKNDPSVAHHLELIINSGGSEHFSRLLETKCGVEHHFVWQEGDGEQNLEELVKRLTIYDTVVLAFHGINVKPRNNFDIPTTAHGALQQLMLQNNVVLVFFGNAYALKMLHYHDNAKATVLAYQENAAMHEAVSDLLAGHIKAEGRLPVTI